jgi:hypothetical protein
MTKFAALLPAALLGLSTMAGAADDRFRDDGPRPFDHDRGWYGPRVDSREFYPGNNVPLYFRPTQRYYGAGYTISYRYVPVFPTDGPYSVAANGASNFRTEKFHIATDDIPSWGANSPRLTVKDPKSGTPRTAITSIVRKKTTTKTTGKTGDVVEPETPAFDPAPAGNQGPAARPSGGSPAPIPPPADAPAPKP